METYRNNCKNNYEYVIVVNNKMKQKRICRQSDDSVIVSTDMISVGVNDAKKNWMFFTPLPRLVGPWILY